VGGSAAAQQEFCPGPSTPEGAVPTLLGRSPDGGSPTTTRAMAKSQFKAGGPTRGRRRVRKIGMGSGKYLLARKEARKGVSVQPQAAEKPESKG